MSEVGAPGAGAATSAPAAQPQSVPLPDSSEGRIPNPATGSPTPSKDEVSEGQPPSGKERRSISDSLDKAFEAQKTDPPVKPEGKAKPEPKTEPKAEPKAKAPEPKDAPAKPSPRERDDGGRFASSQAGQSPGQAGGVGSATSPDDQPRPDQPDHSQPPRNAHFSKEATAEWANTPEPVKAEVHRRIRELEAGHYKNKEAAEAYNEIRPYADFAKQNGTTVPKALNNYMGIEAAVASNDIPQKLEAIERVLARGGLTPQQYAAYITQQPMPPLEQRASDDRQTIMALQREIASIRQERQQEKQERQYEKIEGGVKAFASERPRFDELSLTVASYLNGQNDRGIHINPSLPADQRLQQAYELAEQLNPAARTSAPLIPESRPANGAGTKSIAGSPANGSNPTLPAHRKGQRSSIHDSVDRARARLG